MISSSFGGSSGFNLPRVTGARFRIASCTMDAVLPGNAIRPVAISQRTAPKENKSVRVSSSSPRACSGDHIGLSAYYGAGVGRQFLFLLCCDGDIRNIDTFGSTRELRQTEIKNLRVITFGNEYVRWFDIPVNDALSMGGCERLGNLDSQVEHLFCRQRSVGNVVFQGFKVRPSRNSVAMNCWPSCSPMS